MKAALKMKERKLFYFQNGNKIEGANPNLYGDCSELRGDCTELYGDCSGLRGNCTELYGDCSGLRGNCTELYGDCTELTGDLDDCKITITEREQGILINDLVEKL